MLRIAVAGAVCLCLLLPRLSRGGSSPVPPLQASSLIEHDTTVATQQPGPHGGGGKTTAYSFSRGLLTYSWCFVNARFTMAPRSDTTARRKTRSSTS